MLEILKMYPSNTLRVGNRWIGGIFLNPHAYRSSPHAVLTGEFHPQVVNSRLFERWANSYNHCCGDHTICLEGSKCHEEDHKSSLEPLTLEEREPFLIVIFTKLTVHHTRSHCLLFLFCPRSPVPTHSVYIVIQSHHSPVTVQKTYRYAMLASDSIAEAGPIVFVARE